MSFIRSLFARAADEATNDEEGVIIELRQRELDLDIDLILDLEARLAAAVGDSAEVDGHDLAVDGSDATIYIYGASAESTWTSIAETVQSYASDYSVQVLLRFGSADDLRSNERRIKLSPN